MEGASALRKNGERPLDIVDRCNLVVLEEEGQEDLADFLAKHQVGHGPCIDIIQRRGIV